MAAAALSVEEAVAETRDILKTVAAVAVEPGEREPLDRRAPQVDLAEAVAVVAGPTKMEAMADSVEAAELVEAPLAPEVSAAEAARD